MRRAGLVVADIHDALRENIAAGMTTKDLDAIALEVLESAGATSNFYGYYGYPGQICTSVNDVVVHGIPGERELQPGDLVSLDCGAVVDGWHGDSAFTVVLPGEMRRGALSASDFRRSPTMQCGLALLRWRRASA